MKGHLDFFRETFWETKDRWHSSGGRGSPLRTQHTYRSTPMVSLVRRGGKLPLTALALALAIWIFSSSSALAHGGGHGGGGGFGGVGHGGGFGHHGFGGLGGSG